MTINPSYEELEQRVRDLETETLESKRANEALRVSALAWQTLFDAVTDSVFLIDSEGKILLCNKATVNFLGKPINEIVGNTCWELVHATSEPIKGCPIVRMRETRRPESLELPVGDRVFYVATHPILDQDGNLASAVHIITDITERKQAEDALRDLNERLSKESGQRQQLSRNLIDLLEGERSQISMELHNSIAQTLVALKMELELILEQQVKIDTTLRNWIESAKSKMVATIRDLRTISHGLRPAILDKLGLISAIRDLLDSIKQLTELQIHFFSKNVPKRLDSEKELAIYRIVQESLNNIIKHAQAKKAFVNLVKKGESITLSVEDDGIGFEPDKVMDSQNGNVASGLLIMRERAEQLGGNLYILSRIDWGTHILVEIPI